MRIEDYLPLAEFIGVAASRGTAVILQSIENGVIGIFGRNASQNEGDLFLDSVKHLLDKADQLSQDYYESYELNAKDGEPIHSASYFIKDEGKLLGTLTVVSRVGDAMSLGKSLCELAMMRPVDLAPLPVSFSLSPIEGKTCDTGFKPVDEAMAVLGLQNVHVSRLTSEEMRDIVEWITSEGILSAPGSVEKTAEALKISPSSVYRNMTKRRKLQMDKKRRLDTKY